MILSVRYLMRIHSNAREDESFFKWQSFYDVTIVKLKKLSMDASKTSLHRKCQIFTNKLLLHLLF